jgi:hypothetical protein
MTPNTNDSLMIVTVAMIIAVCFFRTASCQEHTEKERTERTKIHEQGGAKTNNTETEKHNQ